MERSMLTSILATVSPNTPTPEYVHDREHQFPYLFPEYVHDREHQFPYPFV
jgi:hypothetical protein